MHRVSKKMYIYLLNKSKIFYKNDKKVMKLDQARPKKDIIAFYNHPSNSPRRFNCLFLPVFEKCEIL